MRRIYLIRHGMPDFPEGERFCLGSTDMPLGILGRLQACQLGYHLRETPIESVFSSALSRAKQTADFLGRGYTVLPGLEELSAGDWDGLSFREIRRRWPELYERRGEGDFIPIPSSETPEHGERRFIKAVNAALAMSEGDLAIVAHSTVNQALVSLAQGESFIKNIRRHQACCSYYVLGYNGDFTMLADEEQPRPGLDRALAAELMAASGIGEKAAAHGRAVAEKSAQFCGALSDAGLRLDAELTYRAALLHDIARDRPEHPAVGARWLHELGYPREAELIRQHHELDGLTLNEAAVLYIADKCVIEDRPVSLSERFEKSLSRCDSDEARAAHERRAAEAMAVRKMINAYCGKELIP